MSSIFYNITGRQGKREDMAGYLKRYARLQQTEDQEEIVIGLPKVLAHQFRVYLSQLNLSMDEAVQYLIEEELRDHSSPESRAERYKEFWAAVIRDMGIERTPLSQSWYSFASGHKGISYTLSFGRDGRIRIELSIDTGDKVANHRIFDALKAQRHEIEQHFPRALTWDDHDHRRSCRIALYRPGRIHDDNLEELRAWFIRGLSLFQEVFSPLLQAVV